MVFEYDLDYRYDIVIESLTLVKLVYQTSKRYLYI